ncbi:MAG: NFACT family protein [Oscillospiraceae bacterium]|jgi:predicted ribosome quality control (RQC) complex YloA/Tae2 family protein|nr:NFACT family protein [Oscillospiraceae bacterium]
MPLDGLFLRCLRGELEQTILGAHIEKIHHPAKEELLFHLRSRSGNCKLLLCASSGRARIGLVNDAPENPPQPSMLCMLLRKHLTGAALTGIRQPGLERALYFDFNGSNEVGEPTRLCLCAELMGRHSNVLLLREEAGQWRIMDALKRMDESDGALRAVLPGLPYAPPPEQGKCSLTEAGVQTLLAQLAQSGEPPAQALPKLAEGIAPLTAREVCFCAGLAEDVPLPPEHPGFTAELAALQKLAAEGGGTPTLLRGEDGAPAQFSFWPVRHCGALWKAETCESYSALLEAFYAERDAAERCRQQGAELFRLVQNRAARTVRKLEAQRAECAASENRESLRICAELILANRARLEADPAARGSSGYLLENYYDDGRLLAIPVDPALAPAANAQRYFKTYRKAKTAHQLLGGLIEQGEQELEYLESVLDLLTRAQSRAALAELRAELEEQGFCRRKATQKPGKNPAKRRTPPLPPLEYQSRAGLRILVGRSNTQNDRLSFQIAQGSDVWFHAQGCPGSHVILVTGGQEPDPQSLEDAAALALRHSKAHGGSAAVDYTPARMLKKPRGAPPGKVIYHTYKTLWVNPNKTEEDTHGRN